MTQDTSSNFSFSIEGLRCNNCATSLEKKLNQLDNLHANINYSSNKVTLSSSQVNINFAIFRIEELGYQLHYIHHQSTISGWRCGRCANKTKETLEALNGVKNVMVNSTTNKVSFDYAKEIISITKIANVIENHGYQLDQKDIPITNDSVSIFTKFKQHWLLLLSIICTLPLMFPMLAMLVGYKVIIPATLAFFLATIVQFIVGKGFYRGAWINIKNKQANMDTLVVLGTSAAYFYSCYVLMTSNLTIQPLYFESSAVIITFVSLGKWLESRAKNSAGQAMRELLALSSQSALLLKNNQITEVDINDIVVGDRIRVLSGAKIPTDGVIINGQTDIDESLITGESLPIFKQENDPVYAGSINGQGTLELQVSAVGEQSSLNQIIAMVEKAQSTKAPIEYIVDNIAAKFVPAILLIAMATFTLWMVAGTTFEIALINSIAVLVVACPCALGLATPTTIVVGSGVAAKHGIIIRDAIALENASKIDTVAFDKTGTLTLGKPQLIKQKWSTEKNSDALLLQHTLLKSILANSDHPLSKAITKEAFLTEILPVDIENINVIAGLGVTADYQSQQLLLGNKRLMESMGVNNIVIDEEQQSSVVLFAIDDELIAIFYLQDTLRTQSHDAISLLNKLNIKTMMLSGDNKSVVSKVASQLGIEEFKGQLTPQGKLDYLTDCQKHGATIAMVGDGINDAPALTQSNLGIAMGGGTQTAISCAQITLMQDNPLLVVSAINIAKTTWKTVKQNLFLAFIFNVIAIPAAAMGYLSPQLAGIAMASSSLTVLCNALLLKRWKVKN